MQSLDPFERPPDGIKAVYKKYMKMKPADLDRDADIADLEREANVPERLKKIQTLDTDVLRRAFCTYAGTAYIPPAESPIHVYEHQDMPGLYIMPTLLPPEIQILLLDRLLHRDLSNPVHLTNIHTHYTLSYPPSSSSFFNYPPTSPSPIAHPLDPTVHKSLSITPLLTKKLRWLTLGGQYDWTNKRYPSSPPPSFPPDTASLLSTLFPSTTPEAAIVNLYSPGDTLSVHRDVAETCSTGLVSVSLGCDAVFVIGDVVGGEEKTVVLRLKSGSAVYMSGQSRFAWHGVSQIVKGTCPGYLESWPAGEHGMYEEWRGWMAGKRVNLNVRQMAER
ncbi:alkylated DNA repair protein AlkB [Sporormia fimetaria CBS 119925]|uniref:mRNA N(6)-methyladenine demethylase n=1 Tax=Sporormia fimetaria CBS 119925 TaxID=1340428 RepID=A0A6A6UZ84_9PLEO|nr:alkylated DNA repair protein AlkB [Sporormia fimetaria CBS 119925]